MHPTIEPTKEPSYDFMTSDADDNVSIPLEFLGWGPSYPLGECEGDCDSDSHCESGLVCYHRSSNSWGYNDDAVPPGCSGTAYQGADYCYDNGSVSDRTTTSTMYPTTQPTTGNGPFLFFHSMNCS